MSGEFCSVCKKWVYPTTIRWFPETEITSITYVMVEEWECGHIPKRKTKIHWSIRGEV